MDQEWKKGRYSISTDRSRLDLKVIHGFLTESYWAEGRSVETVERSIAHSKPFGLYHRDEQVGFGRVVTDYATFAWIGDVFILPAHRGRGLATWLVEVIISHTRLSGCRRWMLSTLDAHELYRKLGFSGLARPERWMERWDPAGQGAPGLRPGESGGQSGDPAGLSDAE